MPGSRALTDKLMGPDAEREKARQQWFDSQNAERRESEKKAKEKEGSVSGRINRWLSDKIDQRLKGE